MNRIPHPRRPMCSPSFFTAGALPRRLLASLVIAAVPALAAAQNVITVRADSTRRTIAPSSKLAVPVILDMSAAGGTNLASLTTGVTFGAGRLTFDSVRTAGFGSLTANTSSATGGSLTLGFFDATGTTTSQALATMYFTASATVGSATIAFNPAVAGSDVGANIISLMRTRALGVCVASGGKWGDVNGDSVTTPVGDGSVNIIDAQQIARYSVGLTVANRPGLVARGDVTNDGSVNIIDAQQIARFSVSLSAAARVGTATSGAAPTVASVSLSPSTAQTVSVASPLQLAATARDAGNADVSSCVMVTWTSSNPVVATVSSSGLVTAGTAGTATITATSGGQSATVSITVPSMATACTLPGSVLATMAVPQTVTGALGTSDCTLSDGTYADLYKLTLAASQSVQFDLTSNAFDAYLLLYDAAGTIIAVDDDGGGGTNARITWSLAAGTYYFAANSFESSTGSYQLGVKAAASPLATTQAVPSTTGTVNAALAAFTPVTASGGTLPYTFALTGGTLPSGLTFSTSTGQVSGTPRATLATATFTVTVTDAAAAVSAKTFTLTVNAAGLPLTTTQSVPSTTGTVNVTLTAFTPVTASGGALPYTFELAGATLPTGLSFSTLTGQVSGTPTTTLAATTFTVTVTDAAGATSAKTFVLTVVPAKPDLVVDAVTAPSTGSVGGTIPVLATVRNQGTVAGAFRVGFYYSTDATITTADTFSGWSCTVDGGLAANTAWDCSGPIAVPSTLAAGTYYLGAIVDDLAQVSESNESNNARASTTTTVLSAVTAPDLVLDAIAAPSTGGVGGTISVTATVRNQGTAAAGAFRVAYYYSTDATITTADVFAGSVCTLSSGLATSTASDCTGPIAVPNTLSPGTYYVGAIVDDLAQVPESNENNNARASASTTVLSAATGPDLVVDVVTAPSSGIIGGTISVLATVRNQGAGTAGTFRVGFYYSTDATITTADVYSGSACTYASGLAVSTASDCSGSITIPVSLPPGSYYVGAIVDDLAQVTESNESNNSRAAAAKTVLSTVSGMDLVVDAVTAPSTGSIGGTIAVLATVRNQGATATGAFRIGFYYSTDATITTADVYSGSVCTYGGGLAANSASDCSGSITVPSSLTPGTYFVGAIVDDLAQVSESNESNNARASATTTVLSTVAGPDFVVDAVTAPSTGSIGGTLAATARVRNQGTATTAVFRVGFYYSTDATITTADAFSGSVCTYSAGLAANTYSDCSGSITVPSTLAAGTYYVGAIVDDQALVSESNESNNARASSSTTVLTRVGGAASVSAFAGSGQSATVSTAVTIAPAVRVNDASGNAVSGIAVTFAVASGGGSATGTSATTNASGIATVGSWTLGATAGANMLTATVSGSGITGNPVTFTATGTAVSSGTNLNIELRYLSSGTPAQVAAFTAAAARWQNIITAKLPKVALNLAAGACGANTPAVNETIDDIVIFVTLTAIDGPGNILGQAGPCVTRNSSKLPILGTMEFDTADLATMEANGTLNAVILHEMGHVLGIGTIWDQFSGLLLEPSWPSSPGVDTRFVGANAIAGFNAIGGSTYSGGGKVPVENAQGGDGTRDAHWRESVLKNELMTGFISSGSNPLSLLTLRSLQDLGYTVNTSLADAFFLTLTALSIREGSGDVVHLKDDVSRNAITVVDDQGRVLRVIPKRKGP